MTSPHPSSNANQNTAAQDDYISTPAGLRHRSCVYEVESGSHIDKTGRVRRLNGSTYRPAPCQYPMTAERKRALGFPTDSGWQEWSYAYSQSPSGNWSSLSAKWIVPGLPIWSGPNVVYYSFPGLESSAYIVQPVLAYYGGTNGWELQSWYCNTGTNCAHSTTLSANPGDNILGTVSASGCANGQCVWTIVTRDVTTNQATTMTYDDTQNYYYAVGGAVEVYHMQYCDGYPPNDIAYTNIALVNGNGQAESPVWGTSGSTDSPQCNFSVSVAPTLTTLYHNPESVTALGNGVNTIIPNCYPPPIGGGPCESNFKAISASGHTITVTAQNGTQGTITLTGATASGSFTARAGTSPNCGNFGQPPCPPPALASVTGNGTNVLTVTDIFSHTGTITLTGGTAQSATGIGGSGWIHAMGSNAIYSTDASGSFSRLILK